PLSDQSPAAHLTRHDREHFSTIVNSAPQGAPNCSPSHGNLFTLPWNPCSRSRGNPVHHGVEYAIRRSCCRDISPPRITRTRFAASATKDPETGKRLLFISNNTALPALSICALYKARWQVADLDRRVGLRARPHHQEAPKPVSQPVRN